jgi:hypothetical protein
MDRYSQNKINEKLKVIMLQNIKKVEKFYLQKMNLNIWHLFLTVYPS